MDLMDLLSSSGGGNSIAELAGSLGLGSSDASKLVTELAPALMGGLGQQAGSSEGLAGLQNALQTGGHQRYLDDPALMREDSTREDGNNILGHIFGSKDVSRNVAAQAAENTGLDSSLIKKALPMIASLAMGALSKQSSGGQSGGSGGLGALAGLLGGGGDDGFGLDDVMGIAKKLF